MSVVSGEVCKYELILHVLTMCLCSFEIAVNKTFQVLRKQMKSLQNVHLSCLTLAEKHLLAKALSRSILLYLVIR